MGNQYRDKTDKNFSDTLEVQKKQEEKDLANAQDFEIESDAFQEVRHARHVYEELDREYACKLSTNFAHIARAKRQFPPFWDTQRNQPEQLPLYQHNVSSGRYTHSITQLSLTYNAFFPNKSYNKSLIDLKIVDDNLASSESIKDPTQAPGTGPSEPEPPTTVQGLDMVDMSNLIAQGFDNVVKDNSWAKQQHLVLVSDMLNYGAGLYYFPNPKSYKYKHIEFTKARFPSGTTTNTEDWEYLFIEHDISFFDLIKKYEAAPKDNANQGWKRLGLEQVLLQIINRNITTFDSDGTRHTNNKIQQVDNVADGLRNLHYGKVCPARVPIVSCFWKNKKGKISQNIFAIRGTADSLDHFMFEKEDVFDNFSEAFSIFPADETEQEIRMIRGWGERIYTLCHAYDRTFCKFLDHVDHASTLFISMDPNDIHKKILHFGSINVGQYDSVQRLPNSIEAMIAALAFLDAKIDSATFTRGLNKTELLGEGRGAELASILLTTEGRIHKHFNARFLERYTDHYKKVFRKILTISLNSTLRKAHPDVETKFYEYLMERDVPEELLQLDSNSDINGGLPSNWIVEAVRPDGTGVTSSIPHVVQTLQPYLSSLPESGFRYLLGRIVGNAFGDEDMIQKVLPDPTIAKETAEVDFQSATLQAAFLTADRSEFDQDFDIVEGIDPRLSDVSKFITLPATKINDHIMYLTVLLGKVDEAQQSLARREIGRTTLHIWLFNLVSTSQGHVELLRQDSIRSQRPEAQALIQRFGEAFNLLRQVEAQANAERAQKLDALRQDIAEQEQNDPKRIKAIADLETARAKAADVQRKFNSDRFDQRLALDKNRRAEEAHRVDSTVKLNSVAQSRQNDTDFRSQSLVGRPGSDEQRGS